MVEELLTFYNNGQKTFCETLKQYKSDLAQGRKSSFDEVFEKYGSDKSTWHSYTLFYEILFETLMREPRVIFEVGLGTNNLDVVGNMGEDGKPGASLRAWKECLPNASIYGADIDTRVLFTEPRITTFFLDQMNKSSIENAWSIMPHLRFDIFIDDGLHTFEANSNTLDASYARMRPGGLYIIEDIVLSLENVAKFDSYLTARDWDSVLIKLPHPSNNNDNALAIIRPTPLSD